MNHDELEDMLADHLAGELPPEKQAAFAEAMASDPALRAEAESLGRTLGSLSSLGEAPPAKRRAAGPMILRYAAAIAIAFAAGWLIRGSLSPGKDAALLDPRAASPLDAHEWRVRFAETYLEQPAGSDLARSLVAFSRASR